ncbi:MAG TPA: hypothetical protein VM694_14435 [Polyangium sp.]|nr:hypothetical protein [Polyangium sp.]
MGTSTRLARVAHAYVVTPISRWRCRSRRSASASETFSSVVPPSGGETKRLSDPVAGSKTKSCRTRLRSGLFR